MREPLIAALVGLAALVSWALDSSATVTLGPETLLGGLALLVLGQGFSRDVCTIWRLGRARNSVTLPPEDSTASPAPSRWELNLCLESTLGVLLLGLAGLTLVFPVSVAWTMGRAPLLLAASALILAGWLTSEWVITVRHVRDHADLPVWRRGPG